MASVKSFGGCWRTRCAMGIPNSQGPPACPAWTPSDEERLGRGVLAGGLAGLDDLCFLRCPWGDLDAARLGPCRHGEGYGQHPVLIGGGDVVGIDVLTER